MTRHRQTPKRPAPGQPPLFGHTSLGRSSGVFQTWPAKKHTRQWTTPEELRMIEEAMAKKR